MQQTVVASRRPCGDVRTLDEQGPEAAHRAVPLRSRSRNPSADDDDVEFVMVHKYKFNKKICIHAISDGQPNDGLPDRT